jgi:hypothetical protein
MEGEQVPREKEATIVGGVVVIGRRGVLVLLVVNGRVYGWM